MLVLLGLGIDCQQLQKTMDRDTGQDDILHTHKVAMDGCSLELRPNIPPHKVIGDNSLPWRLLQRLGPKASRWQDFETLTDVTALTGTLFSLPIPLNQASVSCNYE